MPRYLPFIIIIIFFSGKICCAQTSQADSLHWLKGWTVSATFVHGKILKHTPKFEPEIQTASNALELCVMKQLHGRQAWEEVHHYPFLGFATAYNDIGNDSVLGKAFWLLPFIEIPMVSGKKFRRGFAWEADLPG